MSPISIAALIQALMAVSELDLGQEAEEERGDLGQGEHADCADEPGSPDGDFKAPIDLVEPA